MSDAFPIHIRTLTGLEKVLAEELAALGGQGFTTANRVVIGQGNLEFLYRTNLWCRTAIRVLRPIATFPAADEKAFYEGIKSIDWSPWMAPDGTLAIDAHVHSSFTTHSLFAAQLAKDAIVDRFRETAGTRPSVDLEHPQLRIAINLYQNTVQVLVDASGESLHKRGYRRQAGEAPLRETLAAGILKLSGWSGETPLVDPMCGSGTFAIEAGMILKNIAPGLQRKAFGFQRWADYDAALFSRLVEEARAAIRKDAVVPILGFDCDPTVAEIARQNVERAGLVGTVRIAQTDFFTENAIPSAPGTVVMNPPYDARLEVKNIPEFYQRIGERLLAAYPGWKVCLLSGNLDAVKYFALPHSQSLTLFNGPMECRLVQATLPLDAQAPARPAPETNAEWQTKVQTFANRLRKNYKHLAKWAAREGVSAYRIYDWDIPEFPFLLDLCEGRLHFAEVPRNFDRSPIEQTQYLNLMVQAAAEVVGIPVERVTFKQRKPKKTGGAAQSATGEFFEVREGDLRFLVNFTDYLDIGLCLEHRKLRARIRKEAAGKDFLNLYGSTGAFTVCAAAGGARSTMTVDTASTYLDWAERNLKLNEQTRPTHEGIRSDAMEFLERTRSGFDLAVVDPPARSMNRVTGQEFDTQADHVRLLEQVLRRMRAGGKIYFSTAYRSFEMDEAALKAGRNLQIREITSQLTPPDFERGAAHRFWCLELQPT